MKELFENTYAFLDGGVRIFLLTGKESALVIDTGMTGPDIRAMAAAHTDLPLRLLNTHADPDHISGNGQFDAFYMHPSETACYYRERGGKGRAIPVFEGDVIDLGERELEIVHLPGHTPGSITVLDRRRRCLIGGDPIQEDGNIYMFGPQRDFGAYIASLKRLLKRNDFDFVYPSHGKEKVGRETVARLIEGAEKIMAGEIPLQKTERFGKTFYVADAGVARFLCEPDAGTRYISVYR